MPAETFRSNEPLMIELTGEPRERGRQYGAAAKSLIEESLRYYREALPIQTGLPWEDIIGRTKRWHAAASEFAPDLLAEVQGIADGSNRTFDEIFLLNVRGEVVYDARFDALGTPDRDDTRDDDGCTSFALMSEATGDGHVYAGQNWDWRYGTRNTLVMVRVNLPSGVVIVYQSEAGQIARQGANSEGVALNANGLGGRFSERTGVPQTFIRRRALEAGGFSAVLQTLVDADSQIASNALVTTREGFAIDLETTPGAHSWLYPREGVLVHGNHFEGPIPAQLRETYRPRSVSSLYRVERARTGLELVRGAESSESVREGVHDAMSDTLGFPDSLCCLPSDTDPAWKKWCTVLSSCVDLTTGEYFYTPGPPLNTPYRKLPWNIYR